MNQAFYLKYRPQTFSDLDCTPAREELIKIFSSGSLPHAFLFTGTKGIGKTSAARIVAKAVNCEERSGLRTTDYRPTTDYRLQTTVDRRPSYEPCNECASCISITNGTNVDVLEIDAASFTGVDDIRDLRDKIRLAPAGAKYKVYIIDEVHRLSGAAFDALLKTLEEPPKHAIFVLCTTELEKLPKTIVSRCQKVFFKKATKKEILERLKKICLSENLKFEEEALEQIIKLSEGSFRDAVKTLEQVSFAGEITVNEINKIAGISGEFKAEDFLLLLQKKDNPESLKWIGKAVEEGVEIKILLENCLEELRRNLLADFGVQENGFELTLTLEEIKTLIALLTKAYNEMKYAVIPQLPLELAVIEWSSCVRQSRTSADKSESGNRKERMEDIVILSETKNLPSKDNIKEDSSGDKPLQNDIVSNFTLDDVLAKWPEILEAVKPLNHSVLAFLKACRPKSVENGFLILEVFYKFHKDQLESEKCRRIFEKAAGEVLGCPVNLKCSLSSETPQKTEPVPLPPVAEKTKASSKKAEEDDIIKVAEEIFNK